MHRRERHRWVVWCGLVVLPAVLNVLLLGASVAKAARVRSGTPSPVSQTLPDDKHNAALCPGPLTKAKGTLRPQ